MNNNLKNPGCGQQLKKLMGRTTWFAENNNLKINRKWITTYKTQDEVSNPRNVMGTST